MYLHVHLYIIVTNCFSKWLYQYVLLSTEFKRFLLFSISSDYVRLSNSQCLLILEYQIFHCDLNLHFLDTNKINLLFICLMAVGISLYKMFIQAVCPFFYRSIFTLSLSYLLVGIYYIL